MAETNTIKDADLIALIQSSGLMDSQKKDLSGLVSFMTASERQELLQLIDESKKFTQDKDAKLVELNKEYTEKLKNTTREQSEYARKEFEKFDTNLNSGDFAVMEAEIQKSDPIGPGKSNRIKVGRAAKHTLRNISIFLFSIILLVSLILYGLSYLNSL